jgi:quercetin dioxygenase-like cupin family protein
MNDATDTVELKKSTPHIIVEILEYVPNSVLIKTIIKKTTGNITVSSLDAGEELAEKTLPFDSFIQIIDGTAQVEIGGKKYKLRLGEGIIIPAHSPHCFNADEQFKMISTIIKSGYEE